MAIVHPNKDMCSVVLCFVTVTSYALCCSWST